MCSHNLVGIIVRVRSEAGNVGRLKFITVERKIYINSSYCTKNTVRKAEGASGGFTRFEWTVLSNAEHQVIGF
ncbi:unnamed protein product [Allacma fusca]|uniref:Uncharacterized protein n=1 Tax=Allacma fusca TaxID=39272 RepID=A0A8J2J2P3_9HEXA|nr:unnamed protein product [Allacma fusca]